MYVLVSSARVRPNATNPKGLALQAATRPGQDRLAVAGRTPRGLLVLLGVALQDVED